MVALYQLDIIIIGAGLGGLSAAIGLLQAGHKVRVVEQEAQVSDVGAGIRVSPNSSRLLIKWGLREKMEKRSTIPSEITIRRYKDGMILSKETVGAHMEEKYGSPYWHIHRADYLKILLDKALEMGLELTLNAFVEKIDAITPAAVLKNGDIIKGDLIIGADGIRSHVRDIVVGHHSPARDTGDMAYRLLAPASEVRQIPELQELLDDGNHASMNFWIGPNCHAASYLLKKGEVYNLVLLCPDKLPDTVNVMVADPDEMSAILKDWDPKVKRLFSVVDKCVKWKLQYTEAESWVHPEGKVSLLGDACHASLPYLGQGAAMAVEDGAALGYLFEKCSSQEDVHALLKTYEKTRKERTRTVAKRSAFQQDIYHLRDGPIQEARDKTFLENEPKEGCPNQYADPVFQKWLWGYKVEEECERNWTEYRVSDPIFRKYQFNATL